MPPPLTPLSSNGRHCMDCCNKNTINCGFVLIYTIDRLHESGKNEENKISRVCSASEDRILCIGKWLYCVTTYTRCRCGEEDKNAWQCECVCVRVCPRPTLLCRCGLPKIIYLPQSIEMRSAFSPARTSAINSKQHQWTFANTHIHAR